MKRRTLLAAALAALAVLAGRAAAGEPLPPSTRLRAEDALVGGRPQDVEAIVGTGTAPEDLELLALRDLVWRPTDERRALPTGEGLSARRIAWMAEHARARAEGRAHAVAYPMPGPGETDLYPRATALLRERLQRETRGGDGLPESSPAWALGDPALRGFIEDFARTAWRTTVPPDATSPDGSSIEPIGRLVRRNWVVAGAVLGAFLLAVGAAMRWTTRCRTRTG